MFNLHKKRYLSGIVAFIILIVFLVNSSVFAYQDYDINKISPGLLEVLEEADPDDEFDVSIWYKEPENILELVQNYKEQVKKMSKEEATLENIRSIKQDYYALLSETYLYHNIEQSKDLEEDDIVHISTIGPVVSAKLTKDEIYSLSLNSNVCIIFYDNCDSLCEYYSDSSNKADEQYDEIMTRSTTYDGTGINIGIIDRYRPYDNFLTTYNIPSTNCYGPALIVERPEDEDHHSEQVALAAMEYAPNATYYFAGIGGVYTTISNIITCLEWLIGNGADIINMSVGGDPPDPDDSDYSNKCALLMSLTIWAEHISFIHSILLVAATGNLGNLGVSYPANGFNTLAVGGAKYDQLSGISYFYSSLLSPIFGSSYNTNLNDPTTPSKPDMCANYEITGGWSGTSFAAPRVAGTAAAILQADPSLIAFNQPLKAYLLATVNYYSEYNFLPNNRTSSTISYMQIGSGILDYDNALLKYIMTEETVGGTDWDYIIPSTSYEDIEIDIDSNCPYNTLCIVLVYDKPISLNYNDHYEYSNAVGGTPANMDIALYAPNGITPIATSATIYNVEKIIVSIQQQGTYTLRITQSDTLNASATYFGVGWFAYDAVENND